MASILRCVVVSCIRQLPDPGDDLVMGTHRGESSPPTPRGPAHHLRDAAAAHRRAGPATGSESSCATTRKRAQLRAGVILSRRRGASQGRVAGAWQRRPAAAPFTSDAASLQHLLCEPLAATPLQACSISCCKRCVHLVRCEPRAGFDVMMSVKMMQKWVKMDLPHLSCVRHRTLQACCSVLPYLGVPGVPSQFRVWSPGESPANSGALGSPRPIQSNRPRC